MWHPPYWQSRRCRKSFPDLLQRTKSNNLGRVTQTTVAPRWGRTRVPRHDSRNKKEHGPQRRRCGSYPHFDR